jgi:hypothetical protein
LNRKALVFFVILIAVAILALPMSAVSAIKPEEITLTGQHMPGIGGTVKILDAGESENTLVKLKDAPDTWIGGITGIAYFSGNWLFDATGPKTMVGYWVFEEVTISNVGTGDLRIGVNGGELWIESGSGELKGVTGSGTVTTVVPMALYNYEVVLQYHP